MIHIIYHVISSQEQEVYSGDLDRAFYPRCTFNDSLVRSCSLPVIYVNSLFGRHHKPPPSAILVPPFHHFYKCLVRNTHFTSCFHFFLSFLLFLSELHLSSNVSSVHMLGDILPEG